MNILKWICILYLTQTKDFKTEWTYFSDDMINIEDFDPNLLKLDKTSYKIIDIYHIGYITVEHFDYVIRCLSAERYFCKKRWLKKSIIKMNAFV